MYLSRWGDRFLVLPMPPSNPEAVFFNVVIFNSMKSHKIMSSLGFSVFFARLNRKEHHHCSTMWVEGEASVIAIKNLPCEGLSGVCRQGASQCGT